MVSFLQEEEHPKALQVPFNKALFFPFLTHTVMLSPMLLKGLKNYVISFPQVLLRNCLLPLCGSRAAIGIVIFVD